MKYIVRTETTEAFGASLSFDSLEEAREQLKLWLDVDKHPDEEYNADWATYIVAVPEEEAEKAENGYTEKETFVEGECGEDYHGRYDEEPEIYSPDIAE
ncbi:hypothetical protein ACTUHY_05630 [Acidaminococcus sp. LBK-2]|uniref:hypothetical protein n=1 Tax=Acidaminococcus sp. LBK-2 TaxID=3456956 RepID=UPI003FA41310